MSILFIQSTNFHSFRIFTCVKLPSTIVMDSLSQVDLYLKHSKCW